MARFPLFIVLTLLMCPSCQDRTGGSHPLTTLDTEEVDAPLPAALTSRTLTWSISEAHKPQTAYQVLIASDREQLQNGHADLYDSGIQVDTDSQHTGFWTSPNSRAFWCVRTWHDSDTATAFTQPEPLSLPSSLLAQRIVFLGGTSTAQMDDYPHLEVALTQYWQSPHITFRNIGWPADDVFGLARSQFGSAQNTRSWQPPTAEEGFGSEVLKQHIADAAPTLLLVGYGAEVAWMNYDSDFDIYLRGYRDLVEYAQSLGTEIILLTPTRHISSLRSDRDVERANENLEKASLEIKSLAKEKTLATIDLFQDIHEAEAFAPNGYQLNDHGHRLVAKAILSRLGISDSAENATLVLDKGGFPQSAEGIKLSNWKRTITGVRFELANASSDSRLRFATDHPIQANGTSLTNTALLQQMAYQDSLRLERLKSAIMQKNNYHRYRIRPLNEAYIFLFRQHEMGHLAGELDQFNELIAEEEIRIQRLAQPITSRIELELPRDWKAPRAYPEDEVPAHVPVPNVAEELKAFTLSPELEINLFAADPMIANPINMNWDARGRAWVATSSTYPHILPGREPNDKIIILEDADGNGQAESSKVFAEGLLVPQSVMPVPGGAYVCSTTEFLFLADTNGDDRADQRHIIYDGFGNADVHHMIHGLRWAPWGDLYFTQSIYINSFVETPYGNRVLNGSGTWSFRPETERLEIFSRGLINPWGHALDQWGQAFATDGAGSSGMNYIYPGSAHATAVGADRVLSGLNQGTPKNTAAEVISSRHLPSHWQGSIITNDFRRNRTVRYVLQNYGSSYQSQEVETLVHSDHRSYRPVDIKMGPDGAIYIVDWYNPIIDHGEVDFHHPLRDRSHGRIWRATAKNRPVLARQNFESLSDGQLLDLLKSPEQLTRLQANRELVRRDISAERLDTWARQIAPTQRHSAHHRLEALWLSVATNRGNSDLLRELLRSASARARAAAVRMIPYFKNENFEADLARLVNDPDAQVRLEVLHALRARPSLDHLSIATDVMADSLDQDLDYALWLTLREGREQWLKALMDGKTLFGQRPDRILFALKSVRDPAATAELARLTREDFFDGDQREEAFEHLAKFGNAQALADVLEQAIRTEDPDLLTSLANAPQDNSAIPDNSARLNEVLGHSQLDLRVAAARLAGRWKQGIHQDLLEKGLHQPHISSTERHAFAAALRKIGAEKKLASLAKTAEALEVRLAAAGEWARMAPRDAAEPVVDLLETVDSMRHAQYLFRAYLQQEEGPDVLASAIAGTHLSKDVAVAGLQLCRAAGRDFNTLIEALEEAGGVAPVGGSLSPQDKAALLAEVKSKGNVGRGRSIYRYPRLQCGSCHHLGGVGGKLGPDLTTVGSYMTPGSILESLLDPGQDIKQGYETILITRKDGSVVGGVLDRKTESSTLLRDATDAIISIPNTDIETLEVSPISLMPAGLTASLRHDELVDLLAFLTSLGNEQMGSWIH